MRPVLFSWTGSRGKRGGGDASCRPLQSFFRPLLCAHAVVMCVVVMIHGRASPGRSIVGEEEGQVLILHDADLPRAELGPASHTQASQPSAGEESVTKRGDQREGWRCAPPCRRWVCEREEKAKRALYGVRRSIGDVSLRQIRRGKSNDGPQSCETGNLALWRGLRGRLLQDPKRATKSLPDAVSLPALLRCMSWPRRRRFEAREREGRVLPQGMGVLRASV